MFMVIHSSSSYKVLASCPIKNVLCTLTQREADENLSNPARINIYSAVLSFVLSKVDMGGDRLSGIHRLTA